MKYKFLIFPILLVIFACNMPVKQPYTGISPILTATAAARMNSGQKPEQNDGFVVPADPSAYIIQSGDSLPALAARFQTITEKIRQENPQLPSSENLTTLPLGQSLTIEPEEGANWSQQELILPNSFFIYGPNQADFDVRAYLSSSQGWLATYIDNSSGNAVSGAQIVEGTADNYSISPRLLLAILEFQLQAITSPETPSSFSLGSTEENRKTLGRQLSWAANVLNNGYYGWREGNQVSFTSSDGIQINPNPSSNAGTVALQYYFSRFKVGEDYLFATLPNGLTSTYQKLFGTIDWQAENKTVILPENLRQPELILPFQPKLKWAYTGGPHSGWGIGRPFAAIDFAPPSPSPGCDPSPHWAVAAAEGVISRSDGGSVVLDMDGDGNSHTGWTLLYLHLSPKEVPAVGTILKTGEQIGHPSCVGGSSSGRNLHIARLYNGEWIPVGGVIPMVLGGWTVSYGEKEYSGKLLNGNNTLTSSSRAEWFSQITAETR